MCSSNIDINYLTLNKSEQGNYKTGKIISGFALIGFSSWACVRVIQSLPQPQPHHWSEQSRQESRNFLPSEMKTIFWHLKNYHLPSFGPNAVTRQPKLVERLESGYRQRNGHARLVLIIIQSIMLCTLLYWRGLGLCEQRWKYKW